MMRLKEYRPRWALRIVGGALWLALLVGGVHAQTATERYDASASGASEHEAIRNALLEAAFQLCGVSIRSDTWSTGAVVVRDGGAEFIERINDRIRVIAGKDECRFIGYEVLGTAREGDDVRVGIQVRYSTYQVPGEAAERRRLAVLDFELDEVHLYGAGGGREQRSGGRVVRQGVDVDYELIRNLQQRFRARIEELLIQGRRFAVLDRRAPEIYEQEKRLLRSSDVDPAEGARLGKVLGADHMLYGTVDRIEVQEQRTEIQLTGESRLRVSGTVRGRFSVLAVATRQVTWSSSLELEWVVEEDLRPEQVAEGLLDELALHLVDEVTEGIFPPVVTQVTGWGSFVVNRGGNTVQVDDRFEVFALGDMLVDPDTGENLGRLEATVGIARITAVKPKYSLAEMVTDTAGIARGMVLRRYHGAIDAGSGRDADGDSGGLRSGDERNYRRIDRDRDRDGMPDYLNRDAQTRDSNEDGLPDYLNRDNLRRR